METKAEIFQLQFFSRSKSACREAVKGLEAQGSGRSVIFANAHVVVESNTDATFKDKLTHIDLIVPDGMPIVWVMHSLGYSQAERYSGPDFMEDLFKETQDKKHFFLGSSQAVLDKIKSKFKGQAVGFYSPPFCKEFTNEELNHQLKLVEESQADYIWVGLGAPKQEKYVALQSKKAKKGVWCAVGAAFEFYAATKPRAPESLQKVGLEWAYRLFTEPRRLAIRYLKTNPQFIKLALKEVAQFKKEKGI